jgi:hypothetical protein
VVRNEEGKRGKLASAPHAFYRQREPEGDGNGDGVAEVHVGWWSEAMGRKHGSGNHCSETATDRWAPPV